MANPSGSPEIWSTTHLSSLVLFFSNILGCFWHVITKHVPCIACFAPIITIYILNNIEHEKLHYKHTICSTLPHNQPPGLDISCGHWPPCLSELASCPLKRCPGHGQDGLAPFFCGLVFFAAIQLAKANVALPPWNLDKAWPPNKNFELHASCIGWNSPICLG
jgi:hypothetical protein